MIKSRPVIGLTRSTVAQSGKKLLYLVTSEPRTVARTWNDQLRVVLGYRRSKPFNIQQVRGFPYPLHRRF
jgi:hypothetical protein